MESLWVGVYSGLSPQQDIKTRPHTTRTHKTSVFNADCDTTDNWLFYSHNHYFK